MRSYYLGRSVPEEDLASYRVAVEVVDFFPDPKHKEPPLRCHEIARVVAHFLKADLKVKAQVVDGIYQRNCMHSWLVLPSGSILDPYCIDAFPQVQLRDESGQAQNSYHKTKILDAKQIRVPNQHCFRSIRKAKELGLDPKTIAKIFQKLTVLGEGDEGPRKKIIKHLIESVEKARQKAKKPAKLNHKTGKRKNAIKPKN